jgi:hypothetical protein
MSTLLIMSPYATKNRCFQAGGFLFGKQFIFLACYTSSIMKRLIVTHHAPDLDAIGAVWLLKRFDNQNYADAQEAFVDSGSQVNPSEAERLGFQMHQVTTVDTGLGEFDHHQPDRGHMQICATSLVYDYICRVHPEEKENEALKYLVDFVTDVDHFGEIHWPEANSPRYCFMIHELIFGFEQVDPHNDESQMHFGLQCLDCAYASLKETFQAEKTIKEGETFELKTHKCLGIETRNDRVIKFAQRAGFALVVRKDPKSGEMRIKARPDIDLDLKGLYERIMELDPIGSWYYHPSGKMLLNGSRKQRHQRPTPLSLQQVIKLLKEIYA